MRQTSQISDNDSALRERLFQGLAIPAHPLALTRRRTLDETRQRALTAYYLSAGAGGIAVGVHTTQFAIREPKHGLLKPVLGVLPYLMDFHLEAEDAVQVLQPDKEQELLRVAVPVLPPASARGL